NIVGTGTATLNFPVGTFYHDERTQVIYPPGEIGGAGRITALSLDVATLPGQIMNAWTIRMKHTPLLAYTNNLWEGNNTWTVVCQTNLNVTAAGWVTVMLTTPFDYNGVDSLMIDFSFNNSSYSSDGYCRATSRTGVRTLYFRTDSDYGDPLAWSGSSPSPNTSSSTPNLRLVMGSGSPVPIQPVTACFTNGVWSDLLKVLAPATNLMLRADSGMGPSGLSNPFDVLPAPPPPPLSFAAPGLIAIPSFGAAAPYPSTNLVAGVVGTIAKASVTLSNINHTFPDDLDILLVGPGGQTVMLMSDAGGAAALVNVTLTFDSDAASSLPDSALITAGTWRPTDYEIGDLLPVPAPAGPYGTNLAVFNGQDPNGAWRLFVADDTDGHSGSIANGWVLQLVVTAPAGNWLLPPRVEAGNIQLRFATAADQSYVIQYKNSLSDRAWQTLQMVVGDGSIMTVQDAINSSTQRYYRLQVP
ncbi:MAG: hypothetical protein NT154_44195, partial [Verrucomicrobia bacterium]|nr:hypothetical protein [Verrucomicrobiota bacterium]